MPERIQKVLARAGLASRREIERWIRQGDIDVNGQPAHLGQQICSVDNIHVRGSPVTLLNTRASTRVLAYYKPEGEICSRFDPQGRPTVFTRLPTISAGRWISIGRLDINTSGLLLFTNDGELVHQLTHPSNQIDREYRVRVLGEVCDEVLAKLKRGVLLEDGKARFSDIIRDVDHKKRANHWFGVVVNEGRNRLVRRLWEHQGLRVSRLIRVRFGRYLLPQTRRSGQYWELSQKDIKALYSDQS